MTDDESLAVYNGRRNVDDVSVYMFFELRCSMSVVYSVDLLTFRPDRSTLLR